MAKKSFKSAISEKTALKEKSGINAVFTKTDQGPVEFEKKNIIDSGIQESIELRQSFIIMSDDLEKLKNYVYHKKATEDPLYSQKAALHEAFHLLFSQINEIPERPERVKRMEQTRNNSIRKKRNLK